MQDKVYLIIYFEGSQEDAQLIGKAVEKVKPTGVKYLASMIPGLDKEIEGIINRTHQL